MSDPTVHVVGPQDEATAGIVADVTAAFRHALDTHPAYESPCPEEQP